MECLFEVHCPSQLSLWRQIFVSMGISLHSVQDIFAVVLTQFYFSFIILNLIVFLLTAVLFLGMPPLFKGAKARNAEVVSDLNIHATGVIPGSSRGNRFSGCQMQSLPLCQITAQTFQLWTCRAFSRCFQVSHKSLGLLPPTVCCQAVGYCLQSIAFSCRHLFPLCFCLILQLERAMINLAENSCFIAVLDNLNLDMAVGWLSLDC